MSSDCCSVFCLSASIKSTKFRLLFWVMTFETGACMYYECRLFVHRGVSLWQWYSMISNYYITYRLIMEFLIFCFLCWISHAYQFVDISTIRTYRFIFFNWSRQSDSCSFQSTSCYLLPVFFIFPSHFEGGLRMWRLVKIEVEGWCNSWL